MPLTIVFSVYLLVHLSLMVFSFRIESQSWRIWLLRAMLFGMLYDNSMLLLSSIYATPDWLKTLNYPRWVLHAAILPFLTLFTLSLLRSANVSIARTTWLTAIFVLFTTICWSYGMWYEVVQLEIAPKIFTDVSGTFASMERFSAVATAPPFGTIFTNIFVLPWAFVIWRATGWKWFFLGALAIFLINGGSGSSPYGFLLGNLGEVIFISALLFTERFFSRKELAVTGN